MKELETFKEALEKLFDEETKAPTSSEEDGLEYFGDSEIKDQCEELACDLLITDDGGCNYPNIRYVRSLGYSVYAGEKDSFGWLTGCIEKDGKVLVYG